MQENDLETRLLEMKSKIKLIFILMRKDNFLCQISLGKICVCQKF